MMNDTTHSTVKVLAGGGGTGFTPGGGLLYVPVQCAVASSGPSGVLIVSDSQSHTVRCIDIERLSGLALPGGPHSAVSPRILIGMLGTGGCSDGDGMYQALLHGPSGIAIDSLYRLYIADTRNRRIIRSTPLSLGGRYISSADPTYTAIRDVLTTPVTSPLPLPVIDLIDAYVGLRVMTIARFDGLDRRYAVRGIAIGDGRIYAVSRRNIFVIPTPGVKPLIT
jgi:hypothetical protein